MRALLVIVIALLAGCAGNPQYQWRKSVDITTATVSKIETDLAPEFCSRLLGGDKRACAIRMTNTENGITNCVIVIPKNDGDAAAHEAGGHCMGYDH